MFNFRQRLIANCNDKKLSIAKIQSNANTVSPRHDHHEFVFVCRLQVHTQKEKLVLFCLALYRSYTILKNFGTENRIHKTSLNLQQKTNNALQQTYHTQTYSRCGQVIHILGSMGFAKSFCLSPHVCIGMDPIIVCECCTLLDHFTDDDDAMQLTLAVYPFTFIFLFAIVFIISRCARRARRLFYLTSSSEEKVCIQLYYLAHGCGMECYGAFFCMYIFVEVAKLHA